MLEESYCSIWAQVGDLRESLKVVGHLDQMPKAKATLIHLSMNLTDRREDDGQARVVPGNKVAVIHFNQNNGVFDIWGGGTVTFFFLCTQKTIMNCHHFVSLYPALQVLFLDVGIL